MCVYRCMYECVCLYCTGSMRVYLYVYVYIFVCMRERVCVYIDVRMSVCVYVLHRFNACTCICICIYICMYERVCVYIGVCMRVCVCNAPVQCVQLSNAHPRRPRNNLQSVIVRAIVILIRLPHTHSQKSVP